MLRLKLLRLELLKAPKELTCTGVGSLARVFALVHDEADRLVKGHAAVLALVRLFTCVDSHVNLQAPGAGEGGAALPADVASGHGGQLWRTACRCIVFFQARTPVGCLCILRRREPGRFRSGLLLWEPCSGCRMQLSLAFPTFTSLRQLHRHLQKDR